MTYIIKIISYSDARFLFLSRQVNRRQSVQILKKLTCFQAAIADEDYEQAAAHLHRFLSMDEGKMFL